MIKAVIFDFDGVLANTMEHHANAYRKILSETGVWIKPRSVYLVEGDIPEVIVSKLLRKPRTDPQVKKLAKKKEEHFRSLRKYIKPEKDGIALLKKLRRDGLKVGVASGTLKRNLDIIMGKDLALLDFALTGKDVKHGKPDPEIYLRAAKKAGAKPEECIVVENAPNGVKAAKAAGMTCIAMTTTLTKGDLKGADHVVGSFQAVGKKIDKIRESSS
jgi:beta-phosphoglucomutase